MSSLQMAHHLSLLQKMALREKAPGRRSTALSVRTPPKGPVEKKPSAQRRGHTHTHRVDCHSVKSTGVGAEDRGYDCGNKLKGRKRHLLALIAGVFGAKGDKMSTWPTPWWTLRGDQQGAARWCQGAVFP